ncbi:ABC transporter substrate-binding protein [Helicobacter sp. MIT 05-5293]|uniref:ABC transporter substrate-binding protein n=1 Tax=Helicobacter sp. MIT 05-5293 TaxID=1548149 RepID=UPI00051CF194|nr:ABC transporter substrate-binding protein [Helicobacter sp. MIT 05-5293]
MNRRHFILTSSLLLSSFTLPFSLYGNDFKSLKIGYLPITDHLLIIAKEVMKSPFTPVKFASWVELSEALRADSIDGAFILTPLSLKLYSQGVNLKALIAAHRNGSALIVKKGLILSSGKRDIHVLKGLKIAIPSRFSTHYLLLTNLLKDNGLSVKDIQLIDMSPPEMLSALAYGNIDGFIVAEPFAISAENREIGDVWILSKDIIDSHICCVLSFRQSVLEQRRQEIVQIIRDFARCALWIKNNPQQSAYLSIKFLGQKAPIIENLLAQDKRVIYESLALTPKDISRVLQDMQESHISNEKIAHLTFKDFVDSSFIEEVSL